jgi:signal transduction histidine kinase
LDRLLPSRRLWLALWPLGVLAGLGSAAVLLTSTVADPQAPEVTMTLAIGWSLIGAGLVGWAERPGNPSGLLLVAAGLAWFLTTFGAAGHAVPFTLGLIVGNLFYAVVFHVLLAFPEGRLRGAARVPVYAVYGLVLTSPFLFMPFYDPQAASECGGGCPENLLLIDADQGVSDAVDAVLNSIAMVAVVVGLAILAARFRAASGPGRRVLLPVLLAGSAFLLAVFALLAVLLVDDDLGDTTFWIVASTLVAVPVAFLVGILRTRLVTGAALGDLVMELAGTTSATELETALGRALRDPSLRLAWWLGPLRGWVDVAGRPVALPEAGSGRTATVVEHEGEPVAALAHDRSLDDNQALLDAAVAAASLALQREQLQADLRARVEELRRSRQRLVEAGDAARRRIERDLHDGAQQRLVALAIDLRLAETALASDPERAAETLRRARGELAGALEELRELARGIHPAILTDRGLGAAIEILVGRSLVPVELHAIPDERLPPPVEAAAYFVLSETLVNVQKYAEASSVDVSVEQHDGVLVVDVRDDGVGGADVARGSGLRGLVDRVEALDGRLRLSSPPGGGTHVRAEIPLTA